MSVENFTTYTIVGGTYPYNTITVDPSNKVTFSLDRYNDGYLYKDKGVDYFDSSFEILATIYIGGTAFASRCSFWTLANDLDDLNDLLFYDKDALYLTVGKYATLQANVTLGETDGANNYGSSSWFPSTQTTWYIKIVRDESVGTYGTLYLYVYDDAARTHLITTLTLALHTSKKDFRYIYAGQSSDVNDIGAAVSGYVEDLEIDTLPSVTTQAVSNITSITATGHGSVIYLGVPSATQHGHCWNTTGLPTIIDNKTENGIPVIGAFISNLTGLILWTHYYVRAYITNTEGTIYGEQVEFTTSNLIRSQAIIIS